jgi:hypothetical protein
METQTIRYNLADRGRKHRGQPRNFNIPRMVKLINSGAIQERVRMRDMHGYLEHLPRIKFGMNPGACQIEGGKMVTIEPAIVTTHLKAFDDGTIEHRAEFLSTPPGQVAERMFGNKVGGFSSAIDEGAPEFYGFDYVSEPNFTLNRGYAVALDGVASRAATLDDVQEYNCHVQGMLRLLDSVSAAHMSESRSSREAIDMLSATVQKLEDENAHFLALLSSGAALDGVSMEAIRPILLPACGADRLRRDIDEFKSARTAAYQEAGTGGQPETAQATSIKSIFGRFSK